MTIYKSCNVIVDTLKVQGAEVKTIYNLDAMVYQAVQSGSDVVYIKEPSLDVLAQINELRPNYNLMFKVS